MKTQTEIEQVRDFFLDTAHMIRKDPLMATHLEATAKSYVSQAALLGWVLDTKKQGN